MWSIFFFILNLFSNSLILKAAAFDAFSVGCVVALSAFQAWVYGAIYSFLSRRGVVCRRLGIFFLVVVIALTNILLITDYFLYLTFGIILSQQAIDVVAGTNNAEAGEFVWSYLPGIFVALGGAALLNVGVYFLARYISRLRICRYFMIAIKGLAVCGALVLTYMVTMFALYRHGAEIPTKTVLTRMAYGYLQHRQNSKVMDRLLAAGENASATLRAGAQKDFDIVLILGESFSRGHSPLYGYDKPTTPRMSALAADSGLTVFTDVVTPEDWTQKVLNAMFPAGDGALGDAPLFPVLLRKAGWRTVLYENEFPLSSFNFFLCNAALSNQMFDSRNDSVKRYDGELTAGIVPADSLGTFYMVHLMGQHFNYDQRYPAGFGTFSPDDYDSAKFNERQRKVLANYDNATLYNDSVVGAVIDLWKNRPAVILYFPDHGEEIYDCRDYFGHGNAISASDVRFQIQIPYIVYTTPAFRMLYPEVAKSFADNAATPITIANTSHLILDLAEVESPSFTPSKSYINPAYDASAPRIVLHALNFDENK